MDEKKMSQRLKFVIAVCVVIGIGVFAGSFHILGKLNHSFNDIIREQMRAETMDYKNRIEQQIGKDFQSLHSLAAFVVSSGMTETAPIARSLSDANLNNDFVTMAYFDADGIGVIMHKEYGLVGNVDYRNLGPESSAAIGAAFAGDESISRLFRSNVSSRLVYIYCVPIFDEDENVQGVLAASDNIEIFNQALMNEAVLNGNGAVHLLSVDGNVLISSEHLEVGTNIFSDTYFSEKDLESIYNVTEERTNHAYVTLHQGEKSYVAYLVPLHINDWYLLCTHDIKNASKTAVSLVGTMSVSALILISLVLFLLFFICSYIAKNNKRLAKLAYKDVLTGADNMFQFIKNLENLREHETAFCIVGLNIKQFKFINEIFGTESADNLLQIMSRKIGKMIKDGEFYARESADLFYICLRDTDEAIIRARIEKVISDICHSPHRKKKNYRLQLYAGAYIHREKETYEISNEMLITRTSFAMKYCKTQPSEFLHFYDEDIHKNEEIENYVETHMDMALQNKEFKLYLQPKILLEDGTLGGAEALVRWVTGDHGMIYPNAFIPQFERNGFCVQLDIYMVEMACQKLREWLDAGIEPIPISVNQSKLLFYRDEYLDTLKNLLEKYRISPHWITLEILEGLALEHGDEMNEKLKILHAMGFRISMDDFGSGYSSFNTLGHLEIDELKLDRSFLVEAASGNTSRFRMIMANIINLSKSLNISTVTEGVETKEDEALIRMLGCDYGQGYLYSKPIPADEFDEKYMIR